MESKAGDDICHCSGARILFSAKNGSPFLWMDVSGTAARVATDHRKATSASGERRSRTIGGEIFASIVDYDAKVGTYCECGNASLRLRELRSAYAKLLRLDPRRGQIQVEQFTPRESKFANSCVMLLPASHRRVKRWHKTMIAI